MTAFEKWTCVFPGKMGICWKQAYPYIIGTKEEAEAAAAQFCNSVAIPLQLYEKMKEHEQRMMAAERKLAEYERRAMETQELPKGFGFRDNMPVFDPEKQR